MRKHFIIPSAAITREYQERLSRERGTIIKGRPAKPTRSEKVEVELIFDFRDGKKPHQPSPRLRLVRQNLAGRSFSEGRRCIHCDTLRIFSHLENSKSGSRSAFAVGRGFAGLPKVLDSRITSPTSTIITSELVTMDLFSQEVVSIMIWNKTIARSFLENFSVMWRSARKYAKTRSK